jgi:hypothetical protein
MEPGMNKKETELFSTLTCPECGHQVKEEMPTNACQYYYGCEMPANSGRKFMLLVHATLGNEVADPWLE